MPAMAEIGSPPDVKYICGMLSARRDLLTRCAQEVSRVLGPVESVSEVIAFDFTDYYRDQMGPDLWRQFISFTGLGDPGRLAEIKRATNEIERRLADESPDGPPRPVNLDPGYVELAKLVLASMKNFAHRVYLRDGVYAEVTLLYREKRWQALPATFPDYASGRYFPFFSNVRESLRKEVAPRMEAGG